MISRQQNYFHPVKEILGGIDREMLSRKFFAFHKTLPPSTDHVFRDNTFMEGIWRDANAHRQISLEDFKKQYLEVIDMNDTECFARFHRINDHIQFTEDSELMNLLTDLTKAYGGSSINGRPAVAFLHTYGKENVLPRHIDPGNIAKITIPLYPDYGNYRNLNFYETTDETKQPNPSHTINYSKIRSPVLIDVSRVHEIADSQTDESLCIQLTYREGYKKALQYLSNKRLLRL